MFEPIPWTNGNGQTRWQPATDTEREWRCCAGMEVFWNAWAETQPPSAYRPVLLRSRMRAVRRARRRAASVAAKAWKERRE